MKIQFQPTMEVVMALDKVKSTKGSGRGKRQPPAIWKQSLNSKPEWRAENLQAPIVGQQAKGVAQAVTITAPPSDDAVTEGSAPASADVAPAVGVVEPSPEDAVTEGSAPAPALVPDVPTADVLRNGDEAHFRMAKIEEILDHAGMHLLEKCALVVEWLHHAEATLSVPGQLVEEPTGGRPEGALTRAARALHVPGKKLTARRKFIERALKIDSIWEEAKSAARAAGLGNIQSDLLAIAHEHSLEDQLDKVKEITARKAEARRKSQTATEPEVIDGANLSIQDAGGVPELAPTSDQIMTTEEETHLAIMRTSWRTANVLRREDWENASAPTRQCFIREELLGMPTREPAQNVQTRQIVVRRVQRQRLLPPSYQINPTPRNPSQELPTRPARQMTNSEEYTMNDEPNGTVFLEWPRTPPRSHAPSSA